MVKIGGDFAKIFGDGSDLVKTIVSSVDLRVRAMYYNCYLTRATSSRVVSVTSKRSLASCFIH